MAMPALAWPESLIRYLVCQGLYVVTVENRGVGTSEQSEVKIEKGDIIRAGIRALLGKPVQAPYSIDDMAGDVIAVMDRLEISRAHIAGISMGGMIGQSIACQAPHRVITLTCMSTSTGNPKMMIGSARALVEMLRSVIGKCLSREEQAKRMEELLRAIGTPGAEMSEAEIGSLMAMCSAKGITQETAKHHLLAILAGGDRRRRLAQLCVPTLVIHGTRDRLLPLRAGRELATTIRGAQFMAVNGMGHDIPKKYEAMLSEAIAKHCYGYSLR